MNQPYEQEPTVVLAPAETGWDVHTPRNDQPEPERVDDVVEALILGDLIAAEIGLPEVPTTRVPKTSPEEQADPRDTQIQELQNKAKQLENALKTRSTTEQAIGVLAARHGLTPEEAFNVMRGESRRISKPVVEIAKVVLSDLRGPAESAESTD